MSSPRRFTPGEIVRVVAWGYGARIGDVGRLGTVRRAARTRVVVDLDEGGAYYAETRHIGPDCLIPVRY